VNLWTWFSRPISLLCGTILVLIVSELLANWFTHTAISDSEMTQPHEASTDLIGMAGAYCLSTFRYCQQSFDRMLKKGAVRAALSARPRGAEKKGSSSEP